MSEMSIEDVEANVCNMYYAMSDTIESVGPDLCRAFADLHELDAVLSKPNHKMTNLILSLCETIEKADGTSSDVRFDKLQQIAKEAKLLSSGGADKLRVVASAADLTVSHCNNISQMLSNLQQLSDNFTAELPDTTIRPSKIALPGNSFNASHAASTKRSRAVDLDPVNQPPSTATPPGSVRKRRANILKDRLPVGTTAAANYSPARGSKVAPVSASRKSPTPSVSSAIAKKAALSRRKPYVIHIIL